MGSKGLLIDYDEDAQEIRFYEVSDAGQHDLAIKVPLSLYQEKGPDGAERLMGETVFTFFDHWAKVKMGLRDYVQEAKGSLARRVVALKSQAATDEASAQYILAIECLTEGIRNRSAVHVEEAETWLKKSAAAGFDDAVEYLAKHWARERASALHLIFD